MDPTLVSGLSALLGSFVGAAATILTTWINYNYQARNARLQADIEQREKLYSDFINTCCKLAVDSYQRSLDSAETILPAYALLNQIRLFSSDAVLAAAEQTMQSILDRYFSKNMPTEQLYNLAGSGKADFDLVRGFAEALPAGVEDFAHSGLTLLPCAKQGAAMQHPGSSSASPFVY